MWLGNKALARFAQNKTSSKWQCEKEMNLGALLLLHRLLYYKIYFIHISNITWKVLFVYTSSKTSS